jgi:hypothetical protein
VIYKL